ncbi:MAG: M14 family metallopeptidase [Gammaproteobacteria bacterium]|nr:M14 family metallopeptidase [Gammaproteobacteria bacterium]
MNPVLFTPAYLAACFSDNYTDAQQKFKQLGHGQPEHRAYREFVYPQTGPNAETLLTAVSWHGDTDAPCLLVLQSATHGVEGFAGSAIQLDTLQTLTGKSLPAGVAVLYIHVLNPFGFAWLRRVNEDGVDLNRNFVDFTRPLPTNTGYAQLADKILPASLADWESATQALTEYANEFGQQALELAVSGGQYQFADGLFYGGTHPSQTRLNLEQIMADFDIVKRKRVAVIDIHSGLGPFGYGEVICDHPPGSTGVKLAKQWYGNSVTEPALGSSTSVTKLGLIDYLWQQQLAEKVCFVTLEFGTYTVDEMFEVLRRDHYLHRNSVAWSAPETQQVKQAVRRFFYPGTADWQEMVLMRGRQCVRQALQGLSSSL